LIGRTTLRYARALLGLSVVVLLFSALAVAFLLAQQHRQLLNEGWRHAESELQIVATFAREALLKRDYQTVEQFLSQWAQEHPMVAAMEAVAPNGFVLVDYQRRKPAKNPLELARSVGFEDRTLLTIRLTWDLTPILKSVYKLRVRLILGAATFVILLAVLLWFTVRRLALIPLERVEAELHKHREHLEGLIKERTSKLHAANERLSHENRERQEAQQELNRTRRKLKNIIDSMPSVLIGVDRRGRITHFNREAERISGVVEDQAKDRFYGEVLPELESQALLVRRAVEQRVPVKADRIARHQGNEIGYWDLMVYPVNGPEGTEGAVIRVDDVSERVRMQKVLVQNEKMMSVGGLAAGMAHEINNPLGAILQGCQNVFRRLSPDLPKNLDAARSVGVELEQVNRYLRERGIDRFVAGIQESGLRAAKIVADMLAFSRRSEVRFEPADLAAVLDAALRLAESDYDLERHYDFKQIVIERDYDPTLGAVPCDSNEIEQVVLNLLKNAAHAMADMEERDNPKIVLRTRAEAQHARIEVIDNGPGIDKALRDRIFEPFFTTKAVGVGTGLGLSVAYFIVTEQHRGSISVDSAPGRGTCFVIRLPLAHRVDEPGRVISR